MEGKLALHSSWQMQALMYGCPMSVATPLAGAFHGHPVHVGIQQHVTPASLMFAVHKIWGVVRTMHTQHIENL